MDKIETTHAGSRRHSFIGVKGDLRVELHYIDLATTSMALAVRHAHCGREACLYVFKVSAPKNGVLVPMCQMWEFLPREIGKKASLDDRAMAERVARNARGVAKQLYGVATQSDEFRVLDVMVDYLEDLKNHPPETGMDKTLDEFLAEVHEDTEGGEFFFEINGERVHLG